MGKQTHRETKRLPVFIHNIILVSTFYRKTGRSVMDDPETVPVTGERVPGIFSTRP